MQEKLISLGFDANEAKVYVALLEFGSAGVSAIAKKAHVNRTTAYDILSRLVEMELATMAVETKKQTYHAEPLEKLPVVLEKRALESAQQAKQAQQLVGELKLVAGRSSKKPRIRLFEGEQGIKSLYEDSLLSKEEIRSFSSTDSLEGFDPAYLHQYYRRRAGRNIFIKAIINDVSSAQQYKRQDAKLNREIRIVPFEKMNVKPETYVYENKVAIFSLKERFGVLIESQDIADALKKLYDLAWDQAKVIEKKV